MNLFVARHAKRHEIALVMRAAIAERLDVMHERRHHKASVRSAHLAQRLSHQMAVANPAPERVCQEFCVNHFSVCRICCGKLKL